MKTIHQTLGACALFSAPLLAIEPPVEHLPIPPRATPAGETQPAADRAERQPEGNAPAEPDDAAEAPAAERPDRVNEPVPMPEAGEQRPFLGIILDPVPDLLATHLRLEPGRGVMILEALEDGPAERAGMTPHDVIVEVDGKAVGSVEDVRAVTAAHNVGDELPVIAFHKGERREFNVELGAAPDAMPAGPEMGRLGGFDEPVPFLQGLPEKHAEKIREALERNLQAFENPGADADLAEGMGEMQRQLMERMHEMQGRLGNMGNLQLKMGGEVESSVRLLDDQGSIEMKSRNGNRQAKVYDNQGNLLWEGPYDTEQDKAAIPDDIRERLERLNFDIEDGGIQMRPNQGRFRPLEQLEPELDDRPAEPAE